MQMRIIQSREFALSPCFELIWDRLDNKKAAIACTYITGLDFDNHDNYPELINKTIDSVLVMRKAFVPFVK